MSLNPDLRSAANHVRRGWYADDYAVAEMLRLEGWSLARIGAVMHRDASSVGYALRRLAEIQERD